MITPLDGTRHFYFCHIHALCNLLKYFQAEDPVSNSLHPYMADERESKKGEGVVDTAKITGTVDINRKLR